VTVAAVVKLHQTLVEAVLVLVWQWYYSTTSW